MKISVDGDRSILLEEVFSGVGFKTKHGEKFGICMRDSGYEFHYNNEWYEAKNGVIKKMETMKKKGEKNPVNDVKDVEGALRNVLEVTPIEDTTVKDKINTEANISRARTVTSSKTEGEVILKYSPKNPKFSKAKTD